MNTQDAVMNSQESFAAPHLTEDDFDDILIGAGSPEAAAHLAACEPCGQRLAAFETQFQAQMSVYNQASLAWSEARSNSISRDLAAHRPSFRVTPAGVWSTACALLLAVTFTVTANLQRQSATLEAANTPAAAAGMDDQPVNADQLASDNAMLAAIDSEMHAPRPAQFGLYENTDAPAQPVHSSAIPQVRD